MSDATQTLAMDGAPSSTDLSPFISARELAHRWSCSVSAVRRICHHAGITTFRLGEGRNGMRRYSRKEVLEFEKGRQLRPEAAGSTGKCARKSLE